MSEQIKNGIILQDEMKVKQSAKNGLWHVEALTVAGSNIEVIMKRIDEAMSEAEKIMTKHNLQVKTNLY